MMTEPEPEYNVKQNHEAKKKRIEAIKAVLARYASGEIGPAEATAEIEAITQGK